MQDHFEPQIPEVLQWRPKWWWDPIPPWFDRDLTAQLGKELMQIQLEKQAQMLNAQLEAVKRTQELFRR